MIAVLTADLIDSSNYEDTLLKLVISSLKEEFVNIQKSQGTTGFKIYRGDSFQGVIYHPAEALKIALRLKTVVNRIVSKNGKEGGKGRNVSADLRMAIGIGSFDFESENIAESNGQAFQFSGRSLDEMKYESRKLRLKTPEDSVNAEFNVSFYFLDLITDRWSTASAEVIYYLLQGLKETEIAAVLNISQSAVNQRKKAAGWDAIEMLLERYKQVISEKFSNGK